MPALNSILFNSAICVANAAAAAAAAMPPYY